MSQLVYQMLYNIKQVQFMKALDWFKTENQKRKMNKTKVYAWELN